MQQLDSLHDPEDILIALAQSEERSKGAHDPVSGRRALSPEAFLRRIQPKLKLAGITRIADISGLAADFEFPVFQTTRPNIFVHHACGQNSGGQGKGFKPVQARISAIMETIEAFGQEPRNLKLVRASYDFLKRSQAVLDPAAYMGISGAAPVRPDEPLMWAPAVSLEHEARVWVPAELVYFPFMPKNYETEPHFTGSSNGAAAGSNYREAVIQGLYEVIERHYNRCWLRGEIVAEGIFDDEFKTFDSQAYAARLPGLEIQFHALRFSRGMNVPNIVCYLMGEDRMYWGQGCHWNVEVAATKALSEALQAVAVVASGSREDIAVDRESDHEGKKKTPVPLADFKTVSPRMLQKTSRMPGPGNQTEELDVLMRWTHQAGFKNVLVANLTRRGIDIPVVKVLVPGTFAMADVGLAAFDDRDMFRRRYPNAND